MVSALTVTFLCYFSSNLSLNSSCSNKALNSSVFTIGYIAVLPVLVFKHQDWASGQERCHESFYYAWTWKPVSRIKIVYDFGYNTL